MSRIAVRSHYPQLFVRMCIPTGYVSPANIVVWRNRVFASDLYQSMPVGKKKRFHDFIVAMLPYHQPKHRYIQITREQIANRIGCSLKTISRYFAQLKAARFLALVAPGRSREKSRLKVNEAPVYTPCLKAEPALKQPERTAPKTGGGESFVHPFVKESRELNPFNAHARKNTFQPRSVSRDSKNKEKMIGLYVPVRAIEGTKRAQRSIEKQAAARLKAEAVDLRRLSTAKITHLCRAFFAADWCVKDILHALETTPAGEQYTTNGAGGMRSKAAWLHLRLRAWCDTDGAPVESPAAARERAREAELAQRAAERAAERKRAAKGVPMPSKIKRQIQFQRMARERGREVALAQFPEFTKAVDA